MKLFISGVFILCSSMMTNDHIIFDFENNNDAKGWSVVDDVVMGGRSSGNFKVNDNGYGLFYGDVSLENNGGFSSVRYYCQPVDANDYKAFKVVVKGDGKNYQFRVKSDRYQRYSYKHEFTTNGEWQEFIIPFEQLEPTFRGRSLDMPSYPGESCEELTFLIANGTAESFELEIKSISLVKNSQ